MKVLVSDPISELGIERLRKDFEVDVITGLTKEELLEKIGEYDALVVRSETKATEEVIEAGKKLKAIGRAGVGIDNINVEAATRKGIVVMNTPEGNTIAAAEHTVALMLSMARNIPQADASMKKNEWKRSKFMGVEVYGKTLGVIGLGRIGSEVVKRALSFEMKVLAYDPFISKERAEQLGVQLATVDEIVKNADFITFHIPKTKETAGMINAEKFAMMKDGVRLINVARGGIINEKDLYDALKSGKVAAAALDVFEVEPAKDNPLTTLENVVATPHLGASTEEAQVNVAVDVAEQIICALKGESVKSAVNIPSVPAEVLSVIKPYLPLAEAMGKFYAQAINGAIEKIEVEYSGEVAKYDAPPLTNAILKGLFEVMQEGVNYVNAPSLAKTRGITITTKRTEKTTDYANLITLKVQTEKGVRSVSGTLFSKNNARIVRVDDYDVDLVPAKVMLFVVHVDKPGIIGKVGTVFGDAAINIGGMQVGRKESGGDAIMVMDIDQVIPDDVLASVKKIDGIKDAKVVVL